MGTFFHHITLIGPSGESESLDALVDTGADFTTVPGRVMRRLGVQPHRTIKLRIANGDLVEWELGRVEAELDGTREQILCVFGAAEAPPVIGAHTLEAFLLGVDPSRGRLVPREAFLM